MRPLSRFRPSPALVLACLALFVALGGVGYAAATIGTAQIRNNSVRSKDIRNNDVRSKDIRNSTIHGRDVASNTLTGSDIDESSLGTVPNAARVNGVTAARIDYRAPGGTATRTILNFGGLVLNATCGGAPDLNVSATTTANNAILHVGTQHADPGGPKVEYSDDNDLDVGQSVNVVPGRDNRVEGTLTYIGPSGSVVTMTYLAEEQTNGLGSPNDCFFLGSATQSG